MYNRFASTSGCPAPETKRTGSSCGNLPILIERTVDCAIAIGQQVMTSKQQQVQFMKLCRWFVRISQSSKVGADNVWIWNVHCTVIPFTNDPDSQLLALDAALPRLAAEDSLAAEIVKLKYFAGLGRKEIATALARHAAARVKQVAT